MSTHRGCHSVFLASKTLSLFTLLCLTAAQLIFLYINLPEQEHTIPRGVMQCLPSSFASPNELWAPQAPRRAVNLPSSLGEGGSGRMQSKKFLLNALGLSHEGESFQRSCACKREAQPHSLPVVMKLE